MATAPETVAVGLPPLTKAQLGLCLGELRYAGLEPPATVSLRALLEADQPFVRRLHDLYPDTRPRHQLNPLDRDMLLDTVARFVTGGPWPPAGRSPMAHMWFDMAIRAAGWVA